MTKQPKKTDTVKNVRKVCGKLPKGVNPNGSYSLNKPGKGTFKKIG